MPLSVKGPKDGEGEGDGEREGEVEGELQQSRRERGSDGGNESSVVEEDDDLEPTIEVIHIPSSSTKTTNRTNSAAARLSYSPDGSRGQTDAQQQQQQEQQQEMGHTKVKTNKWGKLKTGLSRSTKLIGRRLRPGGGRSEKNVVQEICILPSNGLNGECFGECEKKDDEKEEKVEKEGGGRKAKGGRKGRRGGKGKGLGLAQHHRSDSDDSLVFASRVDSGATSSRLSPSVESSSNKKTIIDESIVIYDADYDGQL